MAAKFDFSLIGLKEVKAKMNKVSQTVLDTGTRTALRKAAGIVKKAAQENSLNVDDPKTGRRIRDNVTLQFASRLFKSEGVIMYRVGIATNRGRIPTPNADEGARGNTPHWHLVEFGTEHAQAQPFMRPALANNINQVIGRFTVEFDKELDKALS
ncbi:HK97 gp10 family phage protein [Shewanella baltica]|uniref:HK97-gp10 family putative phage morphogenesis protein n=1 Tax=Shewanella TaxID=22 RepID=UPI0001530B81|nr:MULTISPECIES: HK97-gp10 family putative phage morphogenesis protein [Shewanella]ACK47079.1 phage protein, HK97 gp10 family [Shewanella baltica OS223]MCS6126686.1 HK97 gp10 family phage protein [Shewanella baltica]MCS6138759.1 HK97 gp10 family phage protein [Shewanella baltica]MCS6144948.1 HK97 gp10 family phage protein [Shewanella baltica]MCS6169478.1 HK97 gp10 family phage protein [Shewanella baltica]